MLSHANYLDQGTIESLRELAGNDDPEFLPTLFGDYITDGRMAIEQLHSCGKIGDMSTFTRVAHTLKGSSLNTGALMVAEIAKILEAKGKENSLVDIDRLLSELSAIFDLTTQEIQSLVC